MTGHDGTGHDEQELVRRLLAASRAEEPLPPDVAARLDDALAALVAERTVSAGASVTPLSRRRRRVVSWAVAAAAAVVVGGVAVGQLVSNSGEGDAGSTAADSAAGPSVLASDDAGAGGLPEAAPDPDAQEDREDGGGLVAGDPQPDRSGGATTDPWARASRVATATAERDLAALVATADPGVVAGLAAQGCLPREVRPDDTVVAVLLDGRPATALLRPAGPRGQRVLVRACDDERPTLRLRLAP
ncbi:hypothetical protein [Nocardioides solisilvae]|uniref:hypothetical protein n=1 Tax=Nocardioides solisilvae TaxID=1542435 RepID=UPI000D743F40|nr:hypothetical protein [Nocardioides solisilvae]